MKSSQAKAQSEAYNKENLLKSIFNGIDSASKSGRNEYIHFSDIPFSTLKEIIDLGYTIKVGNSPIDETFYKISW
jgi:endonuclease IV